jgi:uncharacterized protein
MIRSLTIGLPVGVESQFIIETDVKRLIEISKRVLNNAEISPRTVRYTLPPIGSEGETAGYIPSILKWIDRLADETDVRWFCLPIDLITNGLRDECLSVVLGQINRFQKMFLNLMVSDKKKISIPAINCASEFVLQVAMKSNNGFDNFRVGASCNCPANAPFFPFSRHKGNRVAFSFALEQTDLALDIATRGGKNIKVDSFRDCLVEELSIELEKIHRLGEQLAFESGCEYRGLDASFAPFPNEKTSVAALIEKLLGAPVGSHGSLFITGLLTDSIRAALLKSGVLSVGFNGVMYSLLEDESLASANSRRCINIDKLIALSSMCGCGIDMVPVPGMSFPEEIAVLMMDIAAMSHSLKKPLGIRVLPIPGGSANEYTHFNLDFLCDSRIIGLTSNDRNIVSNSHSFSMMAPSRLK